MRTALIAASVAFVFIAPLAIEASGPRMTSEAFVSAVRCAAHEAAAGPRSANAAERAWLNIEAQRQAPEAVARAHNEVISISAAHRAVANPADAAMMRAEREAACAGAPEITARQAGQNAA